MRNGLSSAVKALLANTGCTLNPSPTQCFGMAGRICLTERSDMAVEEDVVEAMAEIRVGNRASRNADMHRMDEIISQR